MKKNLKESKKGEKKRNRIGEWENTGEKISAKHLSDKGLISKLYKELLKLNKDKRFLKWAKDFNRHLPKKIEKWQISTWKVTHHP